MENIKMDFEYYYQEHYQQVYGYIYKKLLNVHDAEDLAMDAFMSCYKKFESFDPAKANFQTWIFVIVNNKLKNHYRDKKNNIDIDDPESYIEPSDDGFEDEIVEAEYLSEMRNYLADAIESLSPIEQAIVKESYFNNKSSKEIAFMLGESDINIRVKLSRAIKKMKNYFDKIGIVWEA